jgi:AcrR family transcriptional regulator
VIPTTEHIDKKEVILREAEKLFGEQDFDAVSIRDLAKAANVNIAMISYYFGSKEKLFEALIASRISESLGSLQDIAASDMSFIEKMYAVIDFYVNRLSTHQSFQKLLHREMSISNRPQFRNLILEKIGNNKQYTKAMVKKAVEDGLVSPDTDIEMTMMSFFATMHHINGSPAFACRMFEKPNSEDLYTAEFKERIANYFKSVIKHQLILNK